jgi:hypothetical protein
MKFSPASYYFLPLAFKYFSVRVRKFQAAFEINNNALPHALPYGIDVCLHRDEFAFFFALMKSGLLKYTTQT